MDLGIEDKITKEDPFCSYLRSKYQPLTREGLTSSLEFDLVVHFSTTPPPYYQCCITILVFLLIYAFINCY